MRILQISSAKALGGGEVHLIELTAKLREMGHQVATAGRTNGPLETDFELPFLNSADLYTAFRLRRIIQREHFDVVHGHVARDYSIITTAMWGLKSTKLVLTRQLIFKIRKHFLYSRVDGWITTTKQILNSIQHLKPNASTIIPNWVDTRKLDYEERGVQSPVTVGLLGEISPHKGHDDALEAFRHLGPHYQLLIGGRGKLSYIKSLERRTVGLPIKFLGFVKPADFLKKVDMLIVPSWEEPFGIVILEAMAAGVNVIATAAGGPPEILENGKSGLLVSPRHPYELASAIQALSADDKLRVQLRKRAIEHVRNHYDISLMIPKIARFYVQLLES